MGKMVRRWDRGWCARLLASQKCHLSVLECGLECGLVGRSGMGIWEAVHLVFSRAYVLPSSYLMKSIWKAARLHMHTEGQAYVAEDSSFGSGGSEEEVRSENAKRRSDDEQCDCLHETLHMRRR
jgi:hypothetical protein